MYEIVVVLSGIIDIELEDVFIPCASQWRQGGQVVLKCAVHNDTYREEVFGKPGALTGVSMGLELGEFVFCCAELRKGLLLLLPGEGEELVVTTGLLLSTEYMKFLDSGMRLFTVMFITYASGTMVVI